MISAFDLLGDGNPLPDPKNFASLGWLFVALAAGAAATNQLWALVIRLKGKPERGGNVGRAELEDRLTDLKNQMTADRTYAHDEIHKLQTETASIRSDHNEGREGLHNRLYAQAELLNYLRGQIEGLMMAARASANSADRAAQATERAVAVLIAHPNS